MENVTWAEALDAVRARSWRGRAITGVTEDTRRLGEGMVFVARRGLRTDGHALLPDAAALGAVLTVGSRSVAPGLPGVIVPESDAALAALVSAWYGDPGRRLTMVGITGTNGKTTVAHLVSRLLGSAGLRPGLLSTVGYTFGGTTLAPTHTTPPPETLYRVLADWVARGATHAVLEVSAQGLSQARTAACPFAVAALTSFAREHGEYYPDVAAYRAAKLRLFADLQGTAVLPLDDPAYPAFADAASHVPVIRTGPGGDVEMRWLAGSLASCVCEMRIADERPVRLELTLPGRHNVRNAASAAAVAWALRLPVEGIARGLEEARMPSGRCQTLWLPEREAWAVVDYGHNPAALIATLRWLRASAEGAVHVVVGARGARDRGKRPLMGAAVAALADGAVFTADRPEPEEPRAAAEPMLLAARDCGLRAAFIRDRSLAIAESVRRLGRGDCLLVTGKGAEAWGPDDNDGPVPVPMDDIRWLQTLGAVAPSPYMADAVPRAAVAPSTGPH